MIRRLLAAFLWLFMYSDAFGQPVLGIDRPVDEVRQRIAGILRCNFAYDDMGTMYGCGSRLRAIRATLSRSAGAKTFDLVQLDVLLANEPGKPTARERALAQTAVDILIYLAPSWPDARNWLISAVTAADTDQACSYMKINGMVISIRPYHYADHEGSYAEISVTRNFDIYSLCEY